MTISLQPLKNALKSSDVRMRCEAVQQLMWMETKAYQATSEVKALLHDPVRDVRLWAACALARINPAQGHDALPHLIECLRLKKELWFQENAAASLVRMGAHAEPALTDLIKVLGERPEPSHNTQEREAMLRLHTYAANVIGNIGPRAAAAVPALASYLTGAPCHTAGEHVPDPRLAVVDALGRIGPAAKHAGLVLKKLASNQHGELALKAAAALVRVGGS